MHPGYLKLRVKEIHVSIITAAVPCECLSKFKKRTFLRRRTQRTSLRFHQQGLKNSLFSNKFLNKYVDLLLQSQRK